MDLMPRSLAASAVPMRFAKQDVGTCIDLGEDGLACLRRIEEGSDEGDKVAWHPG